MKIKTFIATRGECVPLIIQLISHRLLGSLLSVFIYPLTTPILATTISLSYDQWFGCHPPGPNAQNASGICGFLTDGYRVICSRWSDRYDAG